MKKSKIFVTTGSVLEFDDLIKRLDDINKNKDFEIIAQIGIGKYIPKNIKCFNFADNLEKYFDWADVVITHTGAGTLFELLELNKKIICRSNPKAIDNHEIIKKFAKNKYLIFVSGNNLFKLKENIDKLLKENKIKKYIKENNTIGKEIQKFLKI
jgi:beta-1,4-N-acetylglucosaminyltransferase